MGLKLISQTQQRQQQLLLAQPSSSVAAVLTEVTSANRSANRTPSPGASPSPSTGGVEGAFMSGRGGGVVAATMASRLYVQQQQRSAGGGGGGGGGFFDAPSSHQHHPQQQQQQAQVQQAAGGQVAMGERCSSGEQVASSSTSRLMPSSFGGYLANISPSEYRELYEAELPVSLVGADFLRTYGPHLDSATAVDTHTEYAVRNPTAHPVHENHRQVEVADGRVGGVEGGWMYCRVAWLCSRLQH